MADPAFEYLEADLRRVADALEAAGVRYMVVGALSTFAYGKPRSTDDIDVVVNTEGVPEDRLRRILQGTGLVVRGPVEGEFGRRFVLDGGDLPVEVFIGGRIPAQRAMFDRVIRAAPGGREYPFISPEDFVLSKLVNRKIRREQKDYDDAYGVLFRRWDSFDFAQVRARCRVQRICGTFEGLVEHVRNDREHAKAQGIIEWETGPLRRWLRQRGII